ncbi:MAG TPA: hypothetical protein VEC37_02390 [Bacillota bacterium]|nr:hypothetical protein [Bacillota bacterium]
MASKPTSDRQGLTNEALYGAVPGGELSEPADFQTIHFPAGDIKEGYTMTESFFESTPPASHSLDLYRVLTLNIFFVIRDTLIF